MVKSQEKNTSHFVAVSDPVLSIPAIVRCSLASIAVGIPEGTDEALLMNLILLALCNRSAGAAACSNSVSE